MTEQGPTEEEVLAAWIEAPERSPTSSHVRAMLAAAEPLTRARHVREAVEGLEENTVWRLIGALESADDSSQARAALLAALGGTTPPLDETGGKA